MGRDSRWYIRHFLSQWRCCLCWEGRRACCCQNKYAEMCCNYICVPLACEVSGAWCNDGLELLNDLGSRILVWLAIHETRASCFRDCPLHCRRGRGTQPACTRIYQDLPGSIRRLHCQGWPLAGEKKLKAYKYPLTFPKWWSSLTLPWFSFHSYSYPHRLFHPMPCNSSSLSHTCTTIHRFPISPSVLASLGTCFPLSFSTQSWWKQPKFIHHSKLPPTISHPLSAKITIPIIPIVSKSHPNLSYPIYFPLETHQPVKRWDRRWHGLPLSPQFSLYWS